LQQRHGIPAADALLNLALMTGSLSGNGNGLYFLAKENNQVGAWDMGSVPDSLPSRQPLVDESARKNWEENWEVKLSPDPGLTIIRMIEEAEKGNLKALYIMGENPLRSLPQPERISNALKNLEFLVVQDVLATETTFIADVVLPGAAFSEKGGSFTNMEGRIQSFEAAVCPPGDSKPDWEILGLLFAKLGYSKTYSSLDEIRAEIAELVPLYSALDSDGRESWVKESSNLRLLRRTGEGKPIHFSPVIGTETGSLGKDYPFKAILGSRRYHLGSGTRTEHSARIRDFALKGEVEVSPEDGERLDLKKGDRVRISSIHGSILREIILKKDLSLSPWLLIITMP